MRQLPSLLLNVAIVVVAIVVYDRLRGEDTAVVPPPGPSAALKDAIEDVQARLDALEQAPPPSLPDAAVDARLLARIEELERQLETAPTEPSSLPAGSPPAEAKAAGSTSGELSPEAIEEFAKLQAAARQKERSKRIGRSVDRVSEKHRISLSDEQREKLIAAFNAFEPRRNEIWAEAKAEGAAQGGSVDWGVVMRRTNEIVQREFTERISGFISGNDAVVLAEALSTAK